MTKEDLFFQYVEKYPTVTGLVRRMAEQIAEELIRLQPNLPEEKGLTILEAGLLNAMREMHAKLTETLLVNDSVEVDYGDQVFIIRKESLPLIDPDK